MKARKLPRPTEAEMTILRALWQLGPSTVREVWDQISAAQRTGYTTVLKLMQIMVDKGLLDRDERSRSHVYRPARTEEHTQQAVLSHLLEKVFAGSAARLVMQALSAKKASRAELAEIRKLLDKMEGGPK